MVDMEERVARAMAATRPGVRGEADGCVEGTKEAVETGGADLIESVIRKMMDRPLVGIDTIAAFAGVKRYVVESWIDEGLPIFTKRVGGAKYVTTQYVLMEWLRKRIATFDRSRLLTSKEPLQKAVGHS